MAGDKELKIKVSAKTDDFSSRLKDIQKQTEDLEKNLSKAAKISGAAFAALTGIMAGSIAAFRGQELATNQLNQAMKNQGIFSEELSKKYQDQATALQTLTTFGDEEIISAQAQLQSMLGQQEVTEDLTKAVLNLAAAKEIDLASAAELVGKTIGTDTNALMRNGIEIDNSLRGQARLAAVVDALNGKFEGQAEAAAKGSGSFLQLKNAMGDVLEIIGGQLVPILEPVVRKLTELAATIAANQEFAKYAARILIIGTAVSGLVAGAATLGLGLIKLAAIFKAAGGAAAVFSVGIKGLVGATGIGLLLVLITDLALNWDTRLKQMQAAWQAFSTLISTSASGLGKVLTGAFSLDLGLIKEGLKQALGAFSNAADEYSAIRTQQDAAEIEAEKKKISDKEALQAQQRERFKEVQATNALADQEKLKTDEQVLADIQKGFRDAEQQERVKERAQRIEDEKKFGKDLAAVRALFRSKEFAATSQALGDLSTLTQSKNRQLFEIGKAAAIANAVVNTAQSVTKALANFPPPFSFIAAAAAGAAGAVQIGTIRAQGLFEGGMVSGGSSFKDSVPTMLAQGELVAPAKNFDEVVNAVADQRNAQQVGGSAQEVMVEVTLKDDLMNFIETNIIRRRRLGTGLGV